MTGESRTDGDPPPGHLRVTMTSLEMHACPDTARQNPAWPAGARVERAIGPGLKFYRFLYEAVGEPWLWSERLRWSDAALAAHIEDPGIEIWVLTAEGQPAGYAEIDRRDPGNVELSYFGLLPAFIGRGLGGTLLRFAVREAWNPPRGGSGSTLATSIIRQPLRSIAGRASYRFGSMSRTNRTFACRECFPQRQRRIDLWLGSDRGERFSKAVGQGMRMPRPGAGVSLASIPDRRL